MKEYIGQKRILARPMTRGACNDCRGWEMPAYENRDDEGCLVEYLNSPNSNHPDHANYISWSPREVFEQACRPACEMTFGEALEALKRGERVRRRGWNGKGMFLFLLEGDEVPKHVICDPALRRVVDEQCEGDTFPALSTIRMWTVDANGRRGVPAGWLASQTDMLSEDWEIAEEVQAHE